MKYFSLIFSCVFLVLSCSKRNDVTKYPPYKLINEFAQKIKPETDLVLTAYGINFGLPKGYQKKGIGNFTVSFRLQKNKSDEVSLEYARNLIVSLGEKFLEEINSNMEIRPDLDFYPFPSDYLDISVRFVDDNRVQLGQGVAVIYFWEGKIVYEGYKIEQYETGYGPVGKHFTIHKESYAEALETVRKQNL